MCCRGPIFKSTSRMELGGPESRGRPAGSALRSMTPRWPSAASGRSRSTSRSSAGTGSSRPRPTTLIFALVTVLSVRSVFASLFLLLIFSHQEMLSSLPTLTWCRCQDLVCTALPARAAPLARCRPSTCSTSTPTRTWSRASCQTWRSSGAAAPKQLLVTQIIMDDIINNHLHSSKRIRVLAIVL